MLFDILREISSRKGLTVRETYAEDLSLRGHLGMDSFDLAELTVKLEDQVGIDIFVENMQVNTVGDVLSILGRGRVQ
ncbi:acyl carrier protein [Paenibacillus xylaniclasticus]|uniref:acyl carrier protein n=1 Tax=Paenibacillus xylaniclasticus TaxID=588083 RepID=UPI000FDB5EA5|nr:MULTISPECIES: acyl carrier protein [Paenibacillus]